MFIGRKKELQVLNDLYQADQFQCAIIYGRRRIGKTSLINEFVKDKATIYFTGLEESVTENLARFSDAINNYRDDDELDAPSFANFEQAFKKLVRIAQREKVVLVIDEFPYLAQAYPPISSMLQSYIDRSFKQTNLFIILCGSSMSFMENQVLGYQSPLYGRRTAQIKLQPFSFAEAQAYFPSLPAEDVFTLNAITGGIPMYLSLMSANKGIRDNIADNYLNPNAILFAEPSSLLNQELREPANYNSIISAIATGASRQGEIATKTGIASGGLSKYLDNLIDLGIIAKKVPVTELGKARSRKSVYVINDGMFRFWYTFVGRRVSQIERGLIEPVLDQIMQLLPRFMGPEFEKLSQNYLWDHLYQPEVVPTPFIELGNWWGTDAKKREAVEMDIVGFDEAALNGYFGECKWRNELVPASVLEKLIERSRLFSYPQKHFYLFAKHGFTEQCQQLAKQVNCHLITFAEM